MFYYGARDSWRLCDALAVKHYGDNPAKVREFVKEFGVLREMGFSPNKVAEVLAMYDNDREKAVWHFLNGST
ncbi:hypothetical protein QJS10_CPB22g00059 [Acorus calamus]|uniref:Ubiquitin-associated protein 1-like UBA2 domain-containing protein n=1 Tax=Acorus calamus TaxID=4465 RepID=A0AAV9C0G7_ACOCL|nr:hypothetical protein QJS10_CPB22g00059 [Acorus calamus]